MKCDNCLDQLKDDTITTTHSSNKANDSELRLCPECLKAFNLGVQHGEMRMARAAEIMLAPSQNEMLNQLESVRRYCK